MAAGGTLVREHIPSCPDVDLDFALFMGIAYTSIVRVTTAD